jgi:hypothetical protein
VALSHGPLSPPHVVPVALVARSPPPASKIDLQGTVAGFATPNPAGPPGPGNLLLKGSGTVAPLGKVNLVDPFSIRYGEPTFYNGDVTLSDTAGSVEVKITGIVGGPSGPPAHLHYTILSGTGAYGGATGSGNVIYNQGLTVKSPIPFSLTFGNPSPSATGKPFRIATA